MNPFVGEELSPNDAQHYYRNTFFKIKDKKGKEWEVFFCENTQVDENGKFILYGNVIKNGSWYGVNRKVSHIDIDTTIPKLGVINLYRYSVNVTLDAIKQYRKAFTERNTQVVYPFSEIYPYNILYNRQEVSDVAVMKHIFFPEYYSVEECMDKLTRGVKVSCAINNKYYFILDPYENHINIGYKEYRIGRVEDNMAILHNPYKHLCEEISEYITVKEIINEE